MIKFEKINTEWSPEPNAPYPTIFKSDKDIELMFYLNPFIHENTNDDDIGSIKFSNCLKYYLGAPNSEEFYKNKFRYKADNLDFYDFYEVLISDWFLNFPNDSVEFISDSKINNSEFRHFIIFFRDETFECIAQKFEFKNLGKLETFEYRIKMKSQESELLITRY